MSWVNAGLAMYSLASSSISASAEESMGKIQARALAYQGEQEMLAAMEQAKVIRRQGRESLAATTAGYAGAGVRVDSGTPVAVMDQQVMDIEHDATQAILGGMRRNNALRTQGAYARAGASSRAGETRRQGVATALQYGHRSYTNMRDAGWFTKKPDPGGYGPINGGGPGGDSPIPGSRIA